MGRRGRAGVGGSEGLRWVGKGAGVGDPPCDLYRGIGKPSIVAKVRVCGIVLPLV